MKPRYGTLLSDDVIVTIGDVHGCYDMMCRLIDACDNAEPEARLILLGDYIDRGPDSKAVISHLMEAQREQPGRFICLRGNHEEMLFRAAHPARSDHDLIKWWGNGGEQTLASYDVDDPSDIPASHIAWMRSLPALVTQPNRIFVHAGIRPGLALNEQTNEDLLWIREPFLSSQNDHGFLVVHGHTPTPSSQPDLRANRVNLDTGACFGRCLTAALFDTATTAPVRFIQIGAAS